MNTDTSENITSADNQPSESDTAPFYASRRCPNCFWGLYDGEYCLNSACDYKGAEALLLTQKQALLMIYARGADHPLSNGYCSEEWMKLMKQDILIERYNPAMTTAPNSSALATDSNAAGIGCDALFDLDSVALDSPRLTALKAADIQTHHAPHMEDDPWLAVPMNTAREVLEGYNLTEEESGSVAGIMEGYCRLLDEAGMTFLGQTERDVQDAALHFLSNVLSSPTTTSENVNKPIT